MSNTATNTNKTSNLITFENHEQELALIKNAMRLDNEGNIKNNPAWDIFYKQYNRFIFTIANRILHDEDEAEDATQEIFVKCLEQFKQYNQSQPFKPWLSAVVKNFCINEIKKKNAKPTHYIGAISADDCFNQEEDAVYFSAIDNKTQSPLEYAINQETKTNVQRILEKMKPEFREVIELKYFEGMSYEQIANKINKPIGTVMSRLFNAKKKIETIFDFKTGEIIK